jgi:peptidoglycan/LPS O-acetylase OafA/YrhL
VIEFLASLAGGLLVGMFRTDKYAGRITVGFIAFFMIVRVDANLATQNSTSPMIYFFQPLWPCLAAVLGIYSGREVRAFWLSRKG